MANRLICTKLIIFICIPFSISWGKWMMQKNHSWIRVHICHCPYKYYDKVEWRRFECHVALPRSFESCCCIQWMRWIFQNLWPLTLWNMDLSSCSSYLVWWHWSVINSLLLIYILIKLAKRIRLYRYISNLLASSFGNIRWNRNKISRLWRVLLSSCKDRHRIKFRKYVFK